METERIDYFAPRVPVNAKQYTPQPSPIPPLTEEDKIILRRLYFPKTILPIGPALQDAMHTPPVV
jgi:hypothetical protein